MTDPATEKSETVRGGSGADTAGAAGAGDPTPPRLVAIAFTDPLMAQEGMLASLRLQRRGRLRLEDAAIVTRTERGRVRVAQTRDVTPAGGAASGSWWGLVAGLFVGNPLLGAALGAGVGGLFGRLRDLGIDDDEMKRFGEDLTEGHAALFLLVADCHQVACIAELRRFDGRLLHSTVDAEVRERIEEALAVPTGTWA